MWPTIATGETAFISCEYNVYENISSFVKRSCDMGGNWEDVVYSNCTTESEYILDLIKDVSGKKLFRVSIYNVRL